MPTVTVKNRQVWLNDQAVPLIGGEFHYWRLEPSAWQPVLNAAKDMGLDTITSYVQWHYHEYEPGKFDFVGETDPKRNLVSYLNLVSKTGFHLAIRPGPYTFAEWHNYGIPDYVASFHRLHPEFLKSASRYLAAVCDVIRPYLATQGGPIILCQADNMFDLGQGRYDRQLGLLGGSGHFQDYLSQKYEGIDRLNHAWGATYEDFGQALATTIPLSSDSFSHARYLDFVCFKHAYAAEAAHWTINQYRQNGIDVPLYSNATKDQNPVRMAAILDILAFNHYPTRDYSFVVDEHAQLLNHVRLLAALSPVPYIAELESGIWHGYHYTKGIPYPDHYRFMMLTALAGGAVTWSWYMIHDRDNWYMSPINNRGQKRLEVFNLFKQFVDLAHETKPHEWEHIVSAGITYYPLHEQSAHSALEYHRTHDVSKAFYDSGLDFRFVNLLSSLEHQPEILFYDGYDWLEERAQQTLVDYVEQGGHLVVFQRSPRLDEGNQTLNLLGIRTPDGTMSQGYMNTFYKDVIVQLGALTARVPLPPVMSLFAEGMGEPIYAFRVVPGAELNDNVLEEYQYLVELGQDERYAIGYHEHRGKGTVTVLGLPPSRDLILQLHAFHGILVSVHAQHGKLQPVLFRRGNTSYIIVLNNGLEDKGDVIVLGSSAFSGDVYQVRDVLSGETLTNVFSGSLSLQLPVHVPRKGGVMLELKADPTDN